MKLWIITLLPLLLSSCAEILLPLAVDATLQIPGHILQKSAYTANYAHSDHAAISGSAPQGSAWGAPVVSFLCVDGKDADNAGFPYSAFPKIFVTPGRHRIAVAFHPSFTGPATYSELEVEVVAQHAYRLTADKSAHETRLQFWDETGGADQRRLMQNVRRFPVVTQIDRLLRAHKTDAAVIIGDLPDRFNTTGEKSVYLRTLDGRKIAFPYHTYAVYNRLYVPAGTHRIVVDAQGPFWWLESRLSPDIETMFLAQHVYRITAKEIDHEVRLQLWDENEGADERILIKEIRLPGGNNADPEAAPTPLRVG